MRHFINLVENFLCEMIIKYRADEQYVVVAYRDSIWLLDQDDNPPEVFEDIENITGIDAEDVDDLMDQRQSRPDVLISFYNDLLNIDGIVHSEALNPVTSKLLQKVAKQLGITGYSVTRYGDQGDELEEVVPVSHMHGEIPSRAFHGTCTRYIYDILRTGLRPDTQHGNWTEVAKFSDRVFLSSSEDLAFFHARNSAIKTGSKPVVIELTIPDRNLIDDDYDVALAFYGAGHDRVDDQYTNANTSDRSDLSVAVSRHNPKTNYTRETGIFSYRGRIPVRFFQAILAKHNDETEISSDNMYRETDLTAFRDNVGDYEDFGFYDPVVFDEARYDEDEDDY